MTSSGNETAVRHDGAAKLTSRNLADATDPFSLFAEWLAEATESEPNDPNAVALATVDETGLPNVRMVLLKDFSPRGFVFYTNLESRKGSELAKNPKAALGFHWKSLRRQVRVRGPVENVSSEEADAYFSSRPRMARIGAWASKQSQPLEGRFELEKAVALYTARYAVGDVPRPSFWSGFRVVPAEIEFWRDGAFRLHERARFTREAAGGWVRTWLYP
jgi:pyridoxamine 5'-phosphate oxidase